MFYCSVASYFCRSVTYSLHRLDAPSLHLSVAPLLFALLLCPYVAPWLRRYVALRSDTHSICRSSLRRSFAPSIAPYTITFFPFLFLYFNIQTYPRTGTYEGGRTAPQRLAVLITTRPLRYHFFPCTITVMDSEKGIGDHNMDFLFSLDMLKRHQCKIDLERSALVFGLPNEQSLEASNPQ